MDKVVIFGPFPDPIHGMSLANVNLFKFYDCRDDVDVSCFDISTSKTIKSKNGQGKLIFKDLLSGLNNCFKSVVCVFNNIGARFYITPPQSVLGYLRLFPVIFFASFFGKKVVVHIHGSKFSENINNSNLFVRGVVKLSFRFIDRILVLGSTIAFKEMDVLPENKIGLCANGVRIPDNVNLRAKSNDKEKIKILFLSNLMKDKGVLDFLEAVSQFDSQRYLVNIAGAIEPDNEMPILSLLEKNSKILNYHGVVSGSYKDELFRASDVFVLPSFDEGQPLSILEAYSYGCAVITTCVGGIPDIFQAGINGEYSIPGDSNSIIMALEKIERNGIEIYSKNNRAIAVDYYSVNGFCETVDGFLRK